MSEQNELDLSRYEGLDAPHEASRGCKRCSSEHLLREDDPLLLAEVRRLREELAQARDDHHKLGAWPDCPQCTKLYRDDEEAAVKFERLRQSHARLLTAIKDDADLEARDGLCWCCKPPDVEHYMHCAKLRAAVAEAEALL